MTWNCFIAVIYSPFHTGITLAWAGHAVNNTQRKELLFSLTKQELEGFTITCQVSGSALSERGTRCTTAALGGPVGADVSSAFGEIHGF